MSIKINFKKDLVDMSMGAGGRSMNRLIDQLMRKAFSNEFLDQHEDQALLPNPNAKLAFTTDSFVVSPYFFKGGDIGSLAIHGTVNDLAVSGATPKYISVGFILEEGLPLSDLKKIVESMAKAAKESGVYIVTGDTKVVEKGKGDGIFINTAGVGVLEHSTVTHQSLNVGDKIIINGYIAEHGVAVMATRDNLTYVTDVETDATSLNGLIRFVMDQGVKIKTMRDPTRGGVAATLNEWADHYQVGLSISEADLPVKERVASACELLGLDPIFIANEGKVLMVCSDEETPKALQALQAHPLGKDARVIAEVTKVGETFVVMKTHFGGLRRVDWLSGEQLPRIC